jgi:hypothetical protein
VCTEFPKDKGFRAFEMLEKIGVSLKPRRCDGHPPQPSHVTHIHARKTNPPGGAGGARENLALAPVLATSKLLWMMKNSEETHQKSEARSTLPKQPRLS